MASRQSGNRIGSRRGKRTGIGGGLLALLSTVLLLHSAVALTGSSFEILDGNESVEGVGKIDWSSARVIAGQVVLDDESQTSTDESISGDEDATTVRITAGSIQPNKSDIVKVRSFADRESGKDFLYLAFDRFPTTNGVMAIDFELNQKSQGTVPAAGQDWVLNRTAGDKLIVFELVNGGTVPIISMMSWITSGNCEKDGQTAPCWGSKTLLTPETTPAAEGSVNQTGNIVFGEMAIDLVGAGIFKANECTSFASLYVKSRSSGSSLSNQISDLVKPKETTVSNCGSITVTKDVAGPTVADDQDSFDFVVSCPGFDIDPATAGQQTTRSFSLADGGSRKVNDIPVGADCTVTETAPSPADHWSTTYEVDGGAVTPGLAASVDDVVLAGHTVAFVNTRQAGGLSVTKTVSGGAGGESFSFTVACTGHTLAAGDAAFNLANGGTKSISGIPVGTSCTVTETDPGSNWSTTRSVNAATATASRTATVTVDAGGESVAFTNTRNTGALTVTKATSGGTGTFSFTVACSGHSLASGDAGFSLSGGGTKTISGIPTGTSCTVTETDPGSNWSTTYSVDAAAPTAGRSTSSVVDSNGTTIAFTNTRNTGGFVVSKSVVGPTNSADTTSFSFSLSCTGITLAAGDASFSLASGGSKTVSGIPTGTSCTVTESNPGTGWTTTRSVDGASATTSRTATSTVDADGTSVAFTNTRETGGFTISKTVVGPTNAADATTFAFSVSCTGFTLSSGDAGFSLASGASKTISGIPTGTSCTVTETDPGTGWTTTRSVDSAAAAANRTATTTVDADGTSVAFTNTRQTGELEVSKAVVGPTNSSDASTFSFTASCTGFTLAAADASFTLAGGASKTISGIPTGTSCTVTEADPGGNWSTTRSIDSAAATASRTATTSVDANGTSVTFTNTRATGSLTVTKTVTGDTGSFDFTVSCTGFTLSGSNASFSLSGGGTMTISGIPTGTSCTVTETDPGSKWTTSTAVDAAPATPGRTATTTVDADGTTVAVTNVRKTGSLTITKATTGGNDTFSFAVDCTGTAFDQTVVVTTTAGAGSSTPITGIPTETDCTVTETVPVGWAAVGGIRRDVTIDVDGETAAFANRKLLPGIDVTKAASAPVVHSGTVVTYTYVVTNTGETPLSDVTVVDDKCATVTGPAAGNDVGDDDVLGLTEVWTYTCTSILTATTTNVVTATGTDPVDADVSDTATATVTVINPRIAIDKAPSATSVAPGTTVVYTYTVTNPGDVPLTAVTVSDDKCSPVTLARGDANGDGILQLTETWVFTCSQVQTGAIDTLTNVGTARGTDPLGALVTSTDTVTVSVVAPLVLAAPPAPAPAPVATAPVTLPRTGIDVRGWIQLGGSLLLLGVALLLTSRSRRTA